MPSFAILGAHPEISLAEIESITKQTPTAHEESFACFPNSWASPKSIMDLSGSIQKLGRIEATLPKTASEAEIRNTLVTLLSSLSEGKIHFGLSAYGATNTIARIVGMLPALGISTKRALAENERSARVVSTKGNALPAASIIANKLITKGAEVVFLISSNEILIGITEAVQDIDSWVLHDRGRPRTNAKQGMLPPKLARIMLNLAETPIKGKTVCDPFCGSGTVLMEAGTLGAYKLFGSDVNAMAVSDTEANLLWAEDMLNITAHGTLIATPAKDVESHFPPASVDVLVTEPYLGRPRNGSETKQDIEETISYLTRLYEESFAACKTILKPGARIVIASPVHFFEDVAYPVPTTEILTRLGYTALPFAQKENLFYHHEGQYVGRELLRFER